MPLSCRWTSKVGRSRFLPVNQWIRVGGMIMNRALLAFAIGVLAVVVSFVYFHPLSAAQSRQAGLAPDDEAEIQIPGAQFFKTTVHFTTSSVWPSFVLIPGVISINNGTATRNVIIQFSSDAYNSTTTNRSTVRVSVDGGSCIVAGPELFNRNHEAGFTGGKQVRTWIGVVTTGPGAHTYQMCGAVEGGGSASWGFRALTGESRTK